MVLRTATVRWIVGPCVAMVLFAIFAAHSEARPKYKSVFEKTYPQFVKKDKKLTCAFCHFGDDKKHRNHYGVALAKELGKPGVNDEELIREALKTIEEGECRSGKWNERLEVGLAPCVCGRGDLEADSYIGRQLARDKH